MLTQPLPFRNTFLHTLRRHAYAKPLKTASIDGRLGDWTRLLTAATVDTCMALGWQTAAKGSRCEVLPVNGFEYLTIDIMAFRESPHRWRFPVAAIELENSRRTDRIAYSLWKILSVRAPLRIVFCYRHRPEEGPPLIRFLAEEVVTALEPDQRSTLDGETLVVVGSRADAETFPYGFFSWWRLESGTGRFRLL